MFGSKNSLPAGVHKSCNSKNCSFEGTVSIGESGTMVDSSFNGTIDIGNKALITSSKIAGRVKAGQNVKLIDGVELAGEIEIGKYTSINGPNTDLRCRLNPIKIGNFCSIARNVTFQEFNHDFSRLTSYFVNHNLLGKPSKEDIVSKGAIILGHDVWIGTHCVILSGVTIGTGAVIAANTVIAKDVPPYAIVGGNPAEVIKYRFSKNTIERLLASEWWNKSEQEIVEIYRAFGSKKNTEDWTG